MSPMYVVAKWLEIGMIPPASVKKKSICSPRTLKKVPSLQAGKKVYVIALVKKKVHAATVSINKRRSPLASR